jgi:hypothetical protein
VSLAFVSNEEIIQEDRRRTQMLVSVKPHGHAH